MLRRILNVFFNFHLFSSILGFALVLAALTPWVDIENVQELLRPFDALELFLLFPFVLAVFSSRRVPARIYLPILIFSLWSMVGLWPFFGLAPVDLLRSAAIESLSLLIALHNLHLRRHLTGNSLGLFEDRFFTDGIGFSKLRFFILLPLFGFVSALVLSVALIQSAIAEFTRQSRGHVRISWDGLYTKQNIYTKEGRSLYLLGMSHIGDKAFYEKTLAMIPLENSVVLSEGVSDRKHLLEDGVSYAGLSKILNASEQGEEFQKSLMVTHKVVRADVDVSELSPQTIELIRAIGKIYKGKIDTGVLMKVLDPKGAELFKADLIDFRNQRVMSVHDKIASEYRSIVIPWGAMHNGNLEEEILKRGYVLTQSKDIKGLSFF